MIPGHLSPPTASFKLGLTVGPGSLTLSPPPSLLRPPRTLPRRRLSASSWDDKPYHLLPGGQRAYVDEQDVVGFIDPPKELIPLYPDSFNPAAYLWKKIEDIPEERRHRLIYMLDTSLIPRIWGLAGTRYQDDKLAKQSSSTLLQMEGDSGKLEFWSGRTSKGPFPFSWMNDFSKAIFQGKDGHIYGRILINEAIPANLRSFYGPLYFRVKKVTEVLSTEQPCDLAYEFGDGMLDIQDFPGGFPKPGRHRWPFNDHLVVYVRHVGPGILVGQAWQEGEDMDQVPKKFCETSVIGSRDISTPLVMVPTSYISTAGPSPLSDMLNLM